LSFRYTWADWNGVAPDPFARKKLPVLEVSLACAKDLLGQDVEALADKIDRSARPVRVPGSSKGTRNVRLRSRTRESSVDIENVVGLLRGWRRRFSRPSCSATLRSA
jgi:hypothetical protein